MYNSASSLSLGSFDLGAMSIPNRFEWGEHELGHRSSSEHISIELRFRWSRKWKIRSNSQWVSVVLTVELGCFKVTMKTVCVDL